MTGKEYEHQRKTSSQDKIPQLIWSLLLATTQTLLASCK